MPFWVAVDSMTFERWRPTLRPGGWLLDVGCGWGGMVLHAARHHGVEAVGVTISREQFEYARDRVRDEGLDDRVEIRITVEISQRKIDRSVPGRGPVRGGRDVNSWRQF